MPELRFHRHPLPNYNAWTLRSIPIRLTSRPDTETLGWASQGTTIVRHAESRLKHWRWLEIGEFTRTI